MDLRDEKSWRETVYWAPLFDAPAWRGQWVVRGDD
jgi:hypothetical protein